MSLTKEDLQQIKDIVDGSINVAIEEQNHTEQLNGLTFRLNSVEKMMTAIHSDLGEIYKKLDRVEKMPKKEADKVRTELKKDVIKVNNDLQFVAKKLGIELTS